MKHPSSTVMKKIWMLMAAMVLLMVPGISQAALYGFNNITNNNGTDAAIGEAQLFVDVTDPGAGQVSFRFYNTGPAASSITDIYFDDGTLLGIASIAGSGAGVEFSQFASPGNLPGGQAISFHTSAGFSVDSDPPAQPNGVNPGEEVTIKFNLLTGITYADTLAAIALSLANPGVDMVGGLRIGIHVQGFASGGSESFVNRVPEPGTLVLLGSGLLGLAGYGRRKLKM